MAYLSLKRESLRKNYDFIQNKLGAKNIEHGIVSKLLCGNLDYLKEIIDLGVIEIHDSRISNLKKVKQIAPEVQTVYIKPPAKKSIKNLVKYADVSFNTTLSTIKLISDEAKKQSKEHKIIIMIEMGDLREGVMGEELLNFYGEIFQLPNIKVVGIGTNLNCLHGVMPSTDKLIQLSLYKQLIEATFKRKIPWVSGGTSVVFPLLLTKQLPSGINHFRIGESLFFGNNLFTNEKVKGMRDDVFTFHAQIIELKEKPIVPYGELAQNPSGEEFNVKEEDYGKTSNRAILDFGLLDVSTDFLIPKDPNVKISGASSDMVVVDIGKNKEKYKVGDWIDFSLKYMGALSLLNSDYIEKTII